MPDENKIEANIVPRQSWSQESIPSEKPVIRKMINSAIYVEKPLEKMPLQRKTSPLSVTFSDDGKRNNVRKVQSGRPKSIDRTIKRCTCISNPELCQCHPPDSVEENLLSDFWEISSLCSSSSTETQTTVKTQPIPLEMSSDMKLSLTSINTEYPVNIDPREKEERIKQWLKRKEMQKRQKKLDEERAQRDKERQKKMDLEQKKEVHKRWLERKKQQEERLRKQKEKMELEKKREEEERQKKQKEGDQMYQAWLKIKKKEELEKKLGKKVKELKEYEDKRKRLEENDKAFHEWLKHSKGKPRPIPLNRGLSSLCSSVSVTYINPEPWVSNLEPKNSQHVQTNLREDRNWFPKVQNTQVQTRH